MDKLANDLMQSFGQHTVRTHINTNKAKSFSENSREILRSQFLVFSSSTDGDTGQSRRLKGILSRWSELKL